MISAFGVEHEVAKTYVGDGKYRKATEMTPAQHRGARYTRTMEHAERKYAVKGDRSVNAIYHHYGIGRNVQRLRAAGPTTPSAAHKKIEYGPSVPAHERHKLDAEINPKIAGKLKHKVVIHHDEYHTSSVASAAGAHRSLGGKGHVLLGPHAKDMPGTATRSQILNHELAHASVRHRQPYKGERKKDAMMGGEEARADMVSGADIYHRANTPNSHLAEFKHVRQTMTDKGLRAAHFGPPVGKPPVHPHPYPTSGKFMEAAHVHRAAGAALAGAAIAGGYALAHHQNKQVRKSAFGIEHGEF